MEMRRSRVLARLRKGEAVACYKTNLSDARVVEIAGQTARTATPGARP